MKSLKGLSKQMAFPGMDPIASLVERMAAAGTEERGAIFTRREVVEFILNLCGYTEDQPLHRSRLLESSFGDGDFLLVAVDRLLSSYVAFKPGLRSIVGDLTDAIRAVEIHRSSIANTRAKLAEMLSEFRVKPDEVEQLLDAWLIEGDFLLVDLPHQFTHAIGNPPYVRQELIPDKLMAEYRRRYETIYDRADLYVPFIERCLSSLEAGGILGFICADRWMKNRYGRRLRGMIARDYHLRFYIDMVDTPAFHSDVSAYPAITVITRDKPGPTRLVHRPEIRKETLGELAWIMQADTVPPDSGVTEFMKVANGSEPWILHSFDQLALVRRLEVEFPTLEEAGCKVGIGVATGADKVYIGRYDVLDVEADRKLPLATTQDIRDGTVKWHGLGVLNSFHDDGSLVSLSEYPRLARYFQRHRHEICKRNVSKRNPRGWYRTIDRIYPELTHTPKLLIPDIKGEAHIVYEDGKLYPHHNLYFITSEEWDLKALQAVLRSGIAKLFVSIYSTKMRGGYLRFQAQYLRRIRLPRWSDVSEDTRQGLVEAANAGDTDRCNCAAFDLYGLSPQERATIGGNGQ